MAFSSSTCRVDLSFVVPPRNLVIDIQKEIAVEGEEIELNCTAMASRPATTIRWFKGNKELTGTRSAVTGSVHTAQSYPRQAERAALDGSSGAEERVAGRLYRGGAGLRFVPSLQSPWLCLRCSSALLRVALYPLLAPSRII